MPSRFEYERAVRVSGLPPMSRLLALTLATWADVRTGVIPPRLMPSLSTLESCTGMARGSVRTHLDRLEGDGWVTRKRPPVAAARAEKARTQYKIRIPHGTQVPESDGYELGQDMTPAGAGAAPDAQELGQELTQPGAGAAPELGQELTTARAGAALSSSLSDHSSDEYQRGRAPERDLPPAPIDVDGFAVTDQMRRWVNSVYPQLDIEHSTAQFVSHYRSTGTRRKSWPDAWQKWIRDDAKRQSERAQRNPGNVYPLPTGQVLTGTDAKVAGWLALPTGDPS